MADESIDLESVRVRYDHRDGSFRITSADPRLKGKPFQLTLSRESSTMASLLSVFKEEGLIRDEDLIPLRVGLAELKRYDSVRDEYATAGVPRPHRDSRLVFPLGKSSRSELVTIDLGYAAHTLITGAPGTGKTETLRSLAVQSALKESYSWLLDPLGRSYGMGIEGLREGSYGYGLKSSQHIADAILDELYDRLGKLDRLRISNSVDYEASSGPMEPIFLYADSLEEFGAAGWINDILGFGARAGIYLFATVHSSAALRGIGTGKFGRSIAMGVPANASQQIPGVSESLLANIGRAVLQTGDSRPVALQVARGR